MSANLNEFTIDQLQTIISVVEGRLNDLRDKSNQLTMTFKEDSDVKRQLFAMYKEEWDMLQLWSVQLLNALGEVSNQQRIISN